MALSQPQNQNPAAIIIQQGADAQGQEGVLYNLGHVMGDNLNQSEEAMRNINQATNRPQETSQQK